MLSDDELVVAKQYISLGVDGDIRQATQKQHESFWQGGRPQDKVGIAKHRSPIAATAWRQTSGHKQPMVRLNYVDFS